MKKVKIIALKHRCFEKGILYCNKLHASMSGYIYNNNIKFKSYGIFMVHYHRYSSRLSGR